MSIALLRYFIGEQEKEKIMLEIVRATPPGKDPFLDLQLYLISNKIKFVYDVPYSIGLFCSKSDGGVFVVVNNSYTPDWDIPDEKPPIMSTYLYTLKWLNIPEYRNDDKKESISEVVFNKE